MSEAQILGAVGLIAGIGILVYSVFTVDRVFSSGAWVKTDATIVSSRLEEREFVDSDSDGGTSKETVAHIEYEYIVDNQVLHSNRVGLVANQYGSPWAMVKKYLRGSRITIYYDPKNPRKACIIRDRYNPVPWALMVLGLAFVIAALFLLIRQPAL